MNPIVKRTITALATASLAVAGILCLPTAVLVPALVALVALVHLEFSLMVAKRHETMTVVGVAAGLALLVPEFCLADSASARHGGDLVLGLCAAWAFARALFGRYESPLTAVGTTLLGFLYLPVMLSQLVRIPFAFGAETFLYVIAIVKVSDMGGFAFGKAFGRHRLCPTISPNKTWEGLAGSAVASCVVSCAFLPLTHFALPKALGFGVAAALLGTFGDLVESRFKRECGVKDSATFLPAGMGGLLDMFDSLVFAPAVLVLFL